jgi:hypothetical protein
MTPVAETIHRELREPLPTNRRTQRLLGAEIRFNRGISGLQDPGVGPELIERELGASGVGNTAND